MQTKVEGLVISKVPFQDRHMICNLLLRSGRKIAVLFYGGQGGGKKQKSSILELGYMLKVELARSKKNSDMHSAKEWKAIWFHEQIRTNHKAFYLMCFFVEVLQKMAFDDNLYDGNREFDSHAQGLFRVASNALFHLDQSLADKRFEQQAETFIFLTKLLVEHGVFPSRESCVLCEDDLAGHTDISLVPDHGGFACSSCVNREVGSNIGHIGREIWEITGTVANQQYREIHELNLPDKSLLQPLFNYFCYQFQFEKSQFKTSSSVL